MTQETITLREDLRTSLQDTVPDVVSLNDLVNDAVEAYIEARQNEKLDREIAAFVRLQPTLRRTHPNVWVAIHDEQVVDHDQNRRELYRRVRAAYGVMPVLLRHVNDSSNNEIWIKTPSTGRQSA
jgi:hypothetical protein